MAALNELLDRVAAQGGSLVSNAQLLELTARVMAGDYIGSLSIRPQGDAICAPSTANFVVDWTATLYCPTYYFRIYGGYSAENEWTLLDEASFAPRAGSYSFLASASIPLPPEGAGPSYEVMVVAQACSGGSCGWPTPDSYAKKDTAVVPVAYANLDSISAWGSRTGQEVMLSADLWGGSGGGKVKWAIKPIGSRAATSKGEPIPVIRGSGQSFRYTPAADTHGEKQATALLTVGQGGQTCVADLSMSFKLFFEKDGDDDGNGKPNWFEYWKSDKAVPGLDAADVVFNTASGELRLL